MNETGIACQVASVRRVVVQLTVGVAMMAALTFGVLSAVVAKPTTDVRPPMHDAETYSCSSYCYDRYYQCIIAGKPTAYCQEQYSICFANCGGGAFVGD